MTDARPRRRWPKRAVRAVAWTAAGAAFLTGLGALGAAPRPSGAAAVAPVRQKVIVRRIVERVVVVDPVAAPVTIPAGSSTSTGQAPSAPAPAPAPAPTSSGGSHG
jgi:hypothetical protein